MDTEKPDYTISPLSIRVNLFFVILVSSFVLILSFFPESDLFQWIQIQYISEGDLVLGLIPLGFWFIIALFIGIYVPLLMLILYKFSKWLRQVLLPYLIVFMIQIITELIVLHALFPGFALVTGIIYTTYRIWQLQTAISILNQRVMLAERVNVFLQNFLLLAAGYWMLNLVFLLSLLLK